MVRNMLDEVRRAPLDDAGRRRCARSTSGRSTSSKACSRPTSNGARPTSCCRSPATRRPSPSSGSRRPSSSAGSKGCSTASRPRCSPSRWRPRGSSRRCGAARDRVGPGPAAGAARQRLPLMSDPLPAPEPPRMFGSSWTPDGWRARPASQQPDWPDDAALDAALGGASAPAPARLRRRGASAHRVARRRRRGRRVPAAGGRLRGVVRRVLRRRHPRQAQGHPADGRRAHLRHRRADGEGRPHRRAVRQAAHRRPPRPATASSCRRSAATWSTTSRSTPKPAGRTRSG